jgi:hypothetical protein
MRRLAACAVFMACTAEPVPETDAPDSEAVDSEPDSEPVDSEAVDSEAVDSEAVDSEVVDSETDTVPVDTWVDDTGPPPDPCMTARSVVQLGTGEFSFVELTPGADLEMVHGPQDGWHFWAAIRASYSPQFVNVVIDTTHVPSGVVISHLDLTIPLLPDPPPAQPGGWECNGGFNGLFAVLDTTAVQAGVPVYEAICGDEVTMALTLRTLTGELIGRDSVRFVAQPDPVDAAHCGP